MVKGKLSNYFCSKQYVLQGTDTKKQRNCKGLVEEFLGRTTKNKRFNEIAKRTLVTRKGLITFLLPYSIIKNILLGEKEKKKTQVKSIFPFLHIDEISIVELSNALVFILYSEVF